MCTYLQLLFKCMPIVINQSLFCCDKFLLYSDLHWFLIELPFLSIVHMGGGNDIILFWCKNLFQLSIDFWVQFILPGSKTLLIINLFFIEKKKNWIARSFYCLFILQNVAEKEKSAAVSMCLLLGVKIRPSVNLSWPHYRVSMFSSDRVENRVFEMQQMCYQKKKDKKK